MHTVYVLCQVFLYQIQGVSLQERLLIALFLESLITWRNSNWFGLSVPAWGKDPNLRYLGIALIDVCACWYEAGIEEIDKKPVILMDTDIFQTEEQP